MRVLFVEYHAAFRQASSRLMEREVDMGAVAQAGSVREGREKMAEGGLDAALVSVPLPDEGPPRWSGSCTTPTPPSRYWC